MFVLPLTVGAIDIGVVELYRTDPGPLREPVLAHAQILAGRTAWTLMRSILSEVDRPSAEAAPESEPLARREIHQATGMILVQADVPAADALMLLRAHAFAHGQTLEEAAQSVIGRSVTFTTAPHVAGGTALDPVVGANRDAERDNGSDQVGSEEH